MNFSNEEKAKIFNNLLYEYQKLQEQVRQIKAENINTTDEDQRRIDIIEMKMRDIYNQTQRLY
jgi:hypothetical protein